MRVEQAQLLLAVHGVERVIHVQHNPAWNLAEGRTVEIDHGPAHAQQRAWPRQVLQPRDGGLRAQRRIAPEPLQRQLEHRVRAQPAGIVAIFVTGRDHQHAKADDLIKTVHDALRVAWVRDACRKPSSDIEPPLHLAQHQHSAIRR